MSGLSGGSGLEGVVVVTDSLECEGRSLVKSLVSAAALRGEPVHVFSLELSVSDFSHGLDEGVRGRLRFEDGFSDPLHWEQSEAFSLDQFRAPELLARVSWALGTSRGPCTVVVDSLSRVLQRKGATALCRELGEFQRRAAAAGLQIRQVLGLLHADLHPPQVLEVVGQMASAVVTLTPVPEGHESCRDFLPHGVATTLLRKKSGKVVRTVEYFTVEDGFGVRTSVGPVGTKEAVSEGDVTSADPAANLTFNLRLTGEERRAREGVSLPFHFTAARKAALLQRGADGGTIHYELEPGDDVDPEDPDDDLDI
ncbi:elongator complex protein 5 [Pristis pectinata]|uniref:elongator complex protein 5 n=1 Tax=Pristis pectinata TaxID=685728 RepID=UPI00223E1F84|nr:elongator complex protein 5 [Pristis pectinata]